MDKNAEPTRGSGYIGKVVAAALVLASLGAVGAAAQAYVEPRIGAVIPASPQSSSQYTASASGGLAAGYAPKQKGLGFEASVDYFFSKAPYIENNNFLIQGDVTYNLTKGIKILAGPTGLVESSTINIPPPYNVKNTTTSTAVGIQGGIEAKVFDGFNLRV